MYAARVAQVRAAATKWCLIPAPAFYMCLESTLTMKSQSHSARPLLHHQTAPLARHQALTPRQALAEPCYYLAFRARRLLTHRLVQIKNGVQRDKTSCSPANAVDP